MKTSVRYSLIAVMCAVLLLCQTASAGMMHSTNYYSSEYGYTQQIKIYNEKPVAYWTSTGVVTGAQISADFSNGPHYISYSVDGLYEYTDRGYVIRILEMDGANSIVVKEYTSYFTFDGDGRYCPAVPAIPYSSYNYGVEDDGVVELCLYVLIESAPLDTTSYLPAQIFMYRFNVPN